MRSEIYSELECHLEEVLFAGWYGRSRATGIGCDCNETRFRPGNNAITTEILPSDYDRYEHDGIRMDDIVILWIDDDMFIPVSFEWYNDLFNRMMDATEGDKIENVMYTELTAYVNQRMEACGVA